MSSAGTTCGCGAEPREPIACTLDRQGQLERTNEFASIFVHIEQTEPTPWGFRWHFRPVPGLEPRLRELARREHECCRFLEFQILQEGDLLLWETRTEERARPVLEEFMRLPDLLKQATEPYTMKQAMRAAGLTFASDVEPSGQSR
jgi:hypothetical protein